MGLVNFPGAFTVMLSAGTDLRVRGPSLGEEGQPSGHPTHPGEVGRLFMRRQRHLLSASPFVLGRLQRLTQNSPRTKGFTQTCTAEDVYRRT